MASRRRARERALQILFTWDVRRQPVDEAIQAYYDGLYSEEKLERDPFVAELVRGTVEHLAEIDARITRHAEHWRMERMPAVDRNILRVAVYEMTPRRHAGAGGHRRGAGAGAQVLRRRVGAIRQWRSGRRAPGNGVAETAALARLNRQVRYTSLRGRISAWPKNRAPCLSCRWWSWPAPSGSGLLRAQAGSGVGGSRSAEDLDSDVREFHQALALVEANFADKVSPDKTIYKGAIPGMLRTLDPHSNFFDAREYQLMREEQKGHYYGVGMQVGPQPNGKTAVKAPFPGAPAYKVGIRPGDILVSVNDKSTEGLNTTEIADLLKGPRGNAGQDRGVARRRAGLPDVHRDSRRDQPQERAGCLLDQAGRTPT